MDSKRRDIDALTHSDLVLRAEMWLNTFGCSVVLREFVASTPHGEIPDAIGWKGGFSILIECKATRSDFLSDKRKVFRQNPEMGMGHVRLYMCPPGVIQTEDLPDGWGLLWVRGKTVERRAAPKGNTFYRMEERGVKSFHVWDTRGESLMLLSALRRLKIHGHFEEIYDRLECVPLPSGDGSLDLSPLNTSTGKK